MQQIEENSGPLDPDSTKLIPLSQMLVERGLTLPVVHSGCDQEDIVDVEVKDLVGEVRIVDSTLLSGGALSIDSGFC